MDKQTSKLRLYCKTGNLIELRRFLEHSLENSSFDANQRHQMILAVEEVCANMIIHSNHCDSLKFIDIRVFMENDIQVFEISDHAAAFNMLEYPEPDLEEVMKTKRKGGLGIMIVKKVMDKIEYFHQDGRNVIILSKNPK